MYRLKYIKVNDIHFQCSKEINKEEKLSNPNKNRLKIKGSDGKKQQQRRLSPPITSLVERSRKKKKKKDFTPNHPTVSCHQQFHKIIVKDGPYNNHLPLNVGLYGYKLRYIPVRNVEIRSMLERIFYSFRRVLNHFISLHFTVRLTDRFFLPRVITINIKVNTNWNSLTIKVFVSFFYTLLSVVTNSKVKD